MCGIAGLIQWRSRPQLPGGTVAMVNDRLAHRGPDGSGIFEAFDTHYCLLVHRRLAILDPAGGHQPMASADGAIQLVFNGEIYNHRALRRELTLAGHRFHTDHSDTEVLLHGWREWGVHLPEKLTGMFAFAVWDKNAGSLFLARDRLGQKPLFYSALPHGIAFASTLPALLSWPGVSRKVAYPDLAACLHSGYMPPPRTIYKHIHQLTPGHWLLAGCENSRTETFWHPATPDRDPAAIDELPGLLAAAVKTPLYEYVPFVCFLSGLLDSGIIAALMQAARHKAGGAPIHTVSVGFAHTRFDERPHAALVARHLGAVHHEFRIDPQDAATELLSWLMQYTLGQPFADSSILPTYYAANSARMIAPCAISGDGADEFFGGYDRYRAMLLAEQWPRLTRTALYVAHGLFRMQRMERLKAALANQDILAQYDSLMAVFPWTMLRGGFPEIQFEPPADQWMASADGPAGFRKLMLLDQRHYLPGDVLWKVDSASMACGLEVRSPFLDHRVVETANRLANADILDWRQGKRALRRAFRGLLPEDIWRRKKHGFGVPIGDWLAGPLAGEWKQIVLSPHSLTQSLGGGQFAATILAQHQHAFKDHTHRLYSLLMLEIWYSQFQPEIVAS